MAELTIRRLSADDERPYFDCGDTDLNEFFAKDSIENTRELMSVTYVVEDNDMLLAFFSLSNDAIKKTDVVDKPILKKLLKAIPQRKRYSTFPAAKICRLATNAVCQGNGTGSDILDYLKYWFTNGNKTGCRFIIVDAYNNPKTINFYQKNGFNFLLKSDENEHTRLMFFDLASIRE